MNVARTERQRTALITGAAGGIGRALCETFCRAGYRVVGTDRREHESPSDHWVVADVRAVTENETAKGEFFAAVRRHLGGDGLDVLINNAAIQHLAPSEQVTMREWQETLDVNLTAPFVLTQELLPELEAVRGSVVNISSIHASLTKPGFVAYATSKTALLGLTRAMAVDLGGRVRVNAIMPAAIGTEMLLDGFRDRGDALSELGAMHPAGRIGRPDEVAAVALILASDAAGFVSGACWNVDGAIGARLHDPV